MLGIVGMGYVGTRLLERLNEPVVLTSRSPESCRHWDKKGHTVHRLNLDEPLASEPWAYPLNGIFYFVPPQPGGTEDKRMKVFLNLIDSNPPQRLVYISTSGVYGNCAGQWVDEQAELLPGSERASRRVDAEAQLRQFAKDKGMELVILRVPGIYGPDRVPLKRLEAADAVLCPEDAPFSNRIHVDDLVACCLAAMEKENVAQVYNVSDDQPTTMTDYFYSVAEAAGLKRPPCVPLSEAEGVISPGMMSYLKESRRLKNQQMHQDLLSELQYPDLKRGLDSIFGV